jgi:hypothetical protein
MVLMALLFMLGGSSAVPMPFPLPANFSFGWCGLDPTVLPGTCTTSVRLASKVSVSCSTKPGCAPNCEKSVLFQGAFARYEARLGGGGEAFPAAAIEQPERAVGKSKVNNWWRLNNTNCNLHDVRNVSCATLTISQCQAKCEASPDCGAFLFYSKTGRMAIKDTTCWGDIGPLPASDYGDDLFIMRPTPQPKPRPSNSIVLSAVEVCVAAASSEDLGPATDESYSLSVPAASAEVTAMINAPTFFGALHGLETLTQLVDIRVGKGGVRTIPSAPVEVHDKPRFSFRGLMIDSGRHFLPLAHVKRVVEAASQVKLNVIHWHITDASSFPSCSDKFPTLCADGAYPNSYSAGPTSGSSPSRNVSKAVYTTAELRDVVAFAKGYGVRIQPEWDMPGEWPSVDSVLDSVLDPYNVWLALT